MFPLLVLLSLSPSQTTALPTRTNYRLVYAVVGIKTDLPHVRGTITISEANGQLYQSWSGSGKTAFDLLFDGRDTMVVNSSARTGDCRKGLMGNYSPLPLYSTFGELAAKAAKSARLQVKTSAYRQFGKIAIPASLQITLSRKNWDHAGRFSYGPGDSYALKLVAAGVADARLGELKVSDLLPKGGQVVYYEHGKSAAFMYSISSSFESQLARATLRQEIDSPAK